MTLIRLMMLIAATLVVLVAVLMAAPDPAPRAAPQPEAITTEPAETDPTPTLPEILGEDAGTGAEGEPPAEIVQPATQTPEQVQRFPGPPLRPSPEFGGGATPAAPPAGHGGPVLYVTGSRVNMRAGPSTSDAVQGALSGGTAVEALGPTDADWVHIRTPEGQIGYVSGQFLSAGGN